MVSLVAVALQIAAPALAAGETLLEVSAEGVHRATPDVATFTGGVSSDGRTPEAALAAHAATTARLVEAARHAGVRAADLRTADLTVGPRYALNADGSYTDRIIGYRAASRLRVRVSPVARASSVLAALVGRGATEISGPQFTFSDDAPHIHSARLRAVEQAGAEARDYAAALGKRVVRTLRVSERSRRESGDHAGDIVVTGSRVVAPLAASVPIAPGDQEVRVSVWIDYALADPR